MIFSVDKVRADFPVLSREVNGLPLAYLDSAASAQKPSQVIDAEAEFYRHGYAAVHRGIHTLSAQATEKMENVRKRASLFINARSAEELVFVRGTTEGINLVANSWGNSNVRAGDNIIISQMEHHANIVPWQMLCARVGAELRVIPLNPDGTLQLETLPTLFDEKTRLLAITHVSNVLGTENPLAEMITLAHQHGAKVLVDGAQAVMHHPVDVQALDCDFYVFSGHQLYGPTGIGILYVKEACVIFYAAPTGKRNISTLLSWASVCQNYATKTEVHKIAFRAVRVRCGLSCARMPRELLNYRATAMRRL